MFDVNVAIIGEMKAFLHMAHNRYDLQQLFCLDICKDFSRNRKLSFPLLAMFIARLCKRSLSLELERFFADLDAACSLTTATPSPDHVPLPCSVSAYSQQRKKLHPCFFRLWNEVLCQSFYHYTRPEQIRRWKDLRVIAADGSSVALVSTEALQTHFGGQSNQNGAFCAARTFYYYDTLNHIITDALIAPYRSPELFIAYGRIDALPDDSVTVYDRNFCNYKMMALHLWAERAKRFLIRAKESQRYVSDFIDRGSDQEVITLLPPGPGTIKSMRQSGFIISATTGISVRLVRVELPGGGIEVLATNLMAEDGYCVQDLKELYFMRWGVETSISMQKNILMLESFSGQSVVSVEQDFYATVMMSNLEMCLLKDAQQTLDEQRLDGKRKYDRYPVQVNRNKAACRIKERLLDLFMSKEPLDILEQLNCHFIRDVLPVRKGRRFERKRKNRRLNSKHKTFTNYKIA